MFHNFIVTIAHIIVFVYAAKDGDKCQDKSTCPTYSCCDPIAYDAQLTKLIPSKYCITPGLKSKQKINGIYIVNTCPTKAEAQKKITDKAKSGEAKKVEKVKVEKDHEVKKLSVDL